MLTRDWTLRSLLVSFLAIAAAGPLAAQNLGVLFWHDSPNDEEALAGLREGLRATGRSFKLVVLRADSDPARAAAHVAEFRRRGVDLIVALGTEAARVASAEAGGLPVVFTAVTDPVNSGIVPSWKGSGSFVAGNSNHIDPNRVITDFKRAVPGLRTLGVLHSPDNRVSRAEIDGMQAALKERASLGIRLLLRPVREPSELPAAADAVLAESDALWIPIDFGVYSRIEEVAAVAQRHHKPIVTTSQKVEPQAIVAVLPDYHTLGMLAVEIIDRILRRGVEPGGIPVGVMQGRILVINLAAARRCGVTVPIEALAAADRIIPEEPRS